jgi:hypothetical protein
VSPVRYELGFYIPEDDILHCHCRDNLKSYIYYLCVPGLFNDELMDRSTDNIEHSICAQNL